MQIIHIQRGSYRNVSAVMNPAPFVRVDSFAPSGDGWLLIDFRIHLQDKNSTIQCFNDTNYIYAFGHDPVGSTFSVTYLVFLGAQCMRSGFSPGNDLKHAVKGYLQHRVSQRKKIVKITFRSSNDFKGIVTGFDAGVYSEELHIATATISGKIVQAS